MDVVDDNVVRPLTLNNDTLRLFKDALLPTYKSLIDVADDNVVLLPTERFEDNKTFPLTLKDEFIVVEPLTDNVEDKIADVIVEVPFIEIVDANVIEPISALLIYAVDVDKTLLLIV